LRQGRARPALLLWGGLLLGLLSHSAPLVARAQSEEPAPPPPKSPPAEALEHYNRGREHYQAGRYREALQELEVAVNLDPTSPNLVYNVARVYELLGDIDQSIAFYQRYRDLLPPNEQAERERTQLTLLRLEGARKHVDTKPPPPQLIVRKRGVADASFWTVASFSALALVGGSVTGALALSTEHDSEQFRLGKDGGEKGRQMLIDRADRYALSSDLLLIGGASLGITAVLLYALRERTETASAAPLARIDLNVQAWSGGAFFGLRGRL